MTVTATVLGAGSVGLGIAASLAIAGQRVTLLARAGSVAALRASAITVSGLHGEHALAAGAIAIEEAAAPSATARSCDMLVVTTKAHDIAAALAPFAGAEPAPRAVLSLHNGIGASEAIRAALGPGIPIYASAMMIGLERQGIAHVVSKAASSPINAGPLLGDATAPLERFVAAAQGGFLPMRVDPTIRETVLFKLLFNTCMNPTGALTGLTYGELVTHPSTRGLIERLAEETLAVLAAAHGYRPAASGEAYARDTLTPIVIPRSAGHRSSMLQDVAAGRRTEMASLNGAVARLGRLHGIATPTHDALIDLIGARSPGDPTKEVR
ncbi:ketopantoate reductase family protein [Falsiroseomonas oryzae]|uniref:ketopantoate reductase family protein n=1 Tax=Falsiroseomonas oryzae TaxID=2766473 RepID=UPI0022EA9A54|nr:ketopantoate reductase family protein [Roseomonas sp. MO-31]